MLKFGGGCTGGGASTILEGAAYVLPFGRPPSTSFEVQPLQAVQCSRASPRTSHTRREQQVPPAAMPPTKEWLRPRFEVRDTDRAEQLSETTTAGFPFPVAPQGGRVARDVPSRQDVDG